MPNDHQCSDVGTVCFAGVVTTTVPRPPRSRWTSFVADPAPEGKKVRGLHEDGDGWTCLAIHRATRACAVGQGRTQLAATEAAYEGLYTS